MDYLVAGTIFASRSHPGKTPEGPGLLREIRSELDLPLLAIGGITPNNLSACLSAGATGVAVLSSILHSPDPCATARSYWVELKRASVELKEVGYGTNGER